MPVGAVAAWGVAGCCRGVAALRLLVDRIMELVKGLFAGGCWGNARAAYAVLPLRLRPRKGACRRVRACGYK